MSVAALVFLTIAQTPPLRIAASQATDVSLKL